MNDEHYCNDLSDQQWQQFQLLLPTQRPRAGLAVVWAQLDQLFVGMEVRA